jgi:hypothetical protein
MQKKFDSQVVRISDLVVTQDLLEGYEFTNCIIIGPAIFVAIGDTSILNSSFAGDSESIFWVVEPQRPHLIGAIGLKDCEFDGCRFDRVGFAGPAEMKASLPDDEQA